jgi:hypothetical protein
MKEILVTLFGARVLIEAAIVLIWSSVDVFDRATGSSGESITAPSIFVDAKESPGVHKIGEFAAKRARRFVDPINYGNSERLTGTSNMMVCCLWFGTASTSICTSVTVVAW